MCVDDLAKITNWFINNNPRYRTYNVCSGGVIDLVSLANKIKKISQKALPVVVASEGEGKEYSGNNERLLREIWPFPFSDIDGKIKELYSWYESIKKNIDKSKLLFDK